MIQLPTTLRILGLVGRPKAMLPHIKVDDIRQLNFPAFKALGYRGVVFDKDNCITKPGVDTLLPHLRDSWTSCLQTFGPSKVLIVSNSSGTKSDAGWLGAEALHRSTGVPVLLHAKKKPFCHQEVSDYFSLSLTSPLTTSGRLSLPPTSSSTTPLLTAPSNPDASSNLPTTTPSSTSLTLPTPSPPTLDSLGILVIGDRLLTDTLLTSLLPLSPSSISILTTVLSQPKDVRFLRLLERALERLVRRSTGVSHEAAMREWREKGVVKWTAEEAGFAPKTSRLGAVVRGVKNVGRGLEGVGRVVRWGVGMVGKGLTRVRRLVGAKSETKVEAIGGGGEVKRVADNVKKGEVASSPSPLVVEGEKEDVIVVEVKDASKPSSPPI